MFQILTISCFPIALLLQSNVICAKLSALEPGKEIIKESRMVPSGRILEGDVTKEGEFPFVVRLTHKRPGANGRIYNTHCTALFITDIHALTAAHCVVNAKTGRTEVEFTSRLTVKFADGTEQPVCNLMVHPHYSLQSRDDEQMAQNDIAIISLKDSLVFGSGEIKQRYSILSGDNPRLYSNSLFLLGWGLSSVSIFGVPFTNTTKRARVSMLPKEKCPFFDIPEQFCVQTIGAAICMGDSGGALMTSYGHRFHQLGIVVSSNLESNAKCSPIPGEGVITNISFHAEWISDILSKRVNGCGQRYRTFRLSASEVAHSTFADEFKNRSPRSLWEINIA